MLYVQLQNDAKLVSESTRLVAYYTTGGEDRLNLSSKGYVPGPCGRREHSCGNQPPYRNQCRLRLTLVCPRRNRLVACSRLHTQYGTIRRTANRRSYNFPIRASPPGMLHNLDFLLPGPALLPAIQADLSHRSNLKPLYRNDPLDSSENDLRLRESRLLARSQRQCRL